MLHCGRTATAWIAVGLMIFVFGASIGFADDSNRQDGWQPGSPYNQLYDASETDYFRANVVKVTEIVPMPGMSTGVAIMVKEAPDEEPIEVHVCPTWYMDTSGIGLRRGDRIKIRGVWAEIDGRDVFLAAKIKKGDYFVLKVRLTKDGKPFWSMSEEELAREKVAAGSQ
jgi:hypothetical protein